MRIPTLHQLDRIDRHILEILQTSADLPNNQLADRVGLSASPCLRRVRAMEEAGLIRQRVALLDAGKLGLKLTAIVMIGMDRHTPERFEAFAAQISDCPEILECYLVTGHTADYMLKVIVPDMDRYQVFLLQRITRIPGVTGVHSSFVLQRVIERTSLPLNYGLSE